MCVHRHRHRRRHRHRDIQDQPQRVRSQAKSPKPLDSRGNKSPTPSNFQHATKIPPHSLSTSSALSVHAKKHTRTHTQTHPRARTHTQIYRRDMHARMQTEREGKREDREVGAPVELDALKREARAKINVHHHVLLSCLRHPEASSLLVFF